VDVPFVEQQEMEMERKVNLLSDDELNAVVGGRMNNGQINQIVEKNPQYGVPGSFSSSDNALWRGITEGLIFLGIAFGAGMASANPQT
jgi:hypothetical protein